MSTCMEYRTGFEAKPGDYVTVYDAITGKTRLSRNLRGLYDHARRVARRSGLIMNYGSVRHVQVTFWRPGEAACAAFVRVDYRDGSTGGSAFADWTIAARWAKKFASKRGGTYAQSPYDPWKEG